MGERDKSQNREITAEEVYLGVMGNLGDHLDIWNVNLCDVEGKNETLTERNETLTPAGLRGAIRLLAGIVHHKHYGPLVKTKIQNLGKLHNVINADELNLEEYTKAVRKVRDDTLGALLSTEDWI